MNLRGGLNAFNLNVTYAASADDKLNALQPVPPRPSWFARLLRFLGV